MPKEFAKTKRAAMAVFGTAMLAPFALTGLSAQEGRSSGEANYHLKQLTVETSDISLEQFETKTAAIRSCADANELAEELGADLRTDRFVPRWELPESLRRTLKVTPTGRATKVFSDDPDLMRVLVICHRL
jgi:hypothetical protein